MQLCFKFLVAMKPQVQLPKSEGKFTKWIGFIDQFDAAMRNNAKAGILFEEFPVVPLRTISKASHQQRATRRTQETCLSNGANIIAWYLKNFKPVQLILSLL